MLAKYEYLSLLHASNSCHTPMNIWSHRIKTSSLKSPVASFVTTTKNLLYEKEYLHKMRNYKELKEDAAPKPLFGRVGLGWYRLKRIRVGLDMVGLGMIVFV